MNKTIKEIPADTAITKRDEILSRRAVLRGTLLAACSLLVPITLFTAPANATAAAPAATKKLAKAGVKYQDKPKADQKCGSCSNYIAASKTCKVVDGSISPDGYCVLWAKKG